jgi:exopolysaccharide production protein ExoQ
MLATKAKRGADLAEWNGHPSPQCGRRGDLHRSDAARLLYLLIETRGFMLLTVRSGYFEMRGCPKQGLCQHSHFACRPQLSTEIDDGKYRRPRASFDLRVRAMIPGGASPSAPAETGSSQPSRDRFGNRARHRGPAPSPSRAWQIPVDIDGAFACAFFASMLSIGQLGTRGALLFVGLTGLYTLLRVKRLYEILRPRSFLLAFPLVTVLSTFWSETPNETLKHSVEFAMTVGAALLLSAAPRPKAVLTGIAFAIGAYVVISILFGRTVYLGNAGEMAFSGLGTGKNWMADIASTGFLVSTAAVLTGAEDRRPLIFCAAALFALAEAYVVVEARSAGAMLALFLAMAAFVFLLALRSTGFAVRATVTGLLGFLLVVAALGYRGLSEALIDHGARFFDKDPSLTGRTYLWQRAMDLIAEKPFLGKGFSTFWQQGNLDAEGLWQYAGVVSRGGFNFHNTPLEILVHLGWLGLIVFGLTVLVAAVILVSRFVVRPNLLLCFSLSLLVYQLVRMPIESVGVNEFYFSTVLMFLALGSGLGAPRLAHGTIRASQRSRATPRRASLAARI